MADRPVDVYLNDHLGGAMLGSDLAKQIRDQGEGTPLGDVMTTIAAFGGAGFGDRDHGTFMALERLRLGLERERMAVGAQALRGD